MCHYSGYTQADFEQLLQRCAAIEGKFLLFSYPSKVLDRYTKENGWHQIEIPMVASSSAKRKIKVEVLTANYPIMLS